MGIITRLLEETIFAPIGYIIVDIIGYIVEGLLIFYNVIMESLLPFEIDVVSVCKPYDAAFKVAYEYG